MITSYLEKRHFKPTLSEPIKPETELVIVIPSHDEHELFKSLQSLSDCLPGTSPVEVMVVLNSSSDSQEEVTDLHRKQHITLQDASNKLNKPHITFHSILIEDMNPKEAGVGLARKTGMDEAVYRLESSGKDLGWVVCFDADCTCDPNYIQALEIEFKKHPKATAASIYFEHKYDSPDEPIVKYELHLRYFRQALLWSDHPFAFHTVGSCMAVRADAYAAQSGMNKKKAGEDFYFLQKHIPQGNFLEINTTAVYPSSRKSNRVPFGTGRAMLEFEEGRDLSLTYPFAAFEDIQVFIEEIKHEYDGSRSFDHIFEQRLPEIMRDFLSENNFQDRVPDLLQYGKNWETFKKRFYNWFGVFRAMKFIHFARDNNYGVGNLLEETNKLLLAKNLEPAQSLEAQLSKYRQLDKRI